MLLDASSLRRQVGNQAAAINQLAKNSGLNQPTLRERMGHTAIEILAGLATGAGVAYLIATVRLT